ncbi:hypothetical protein V7S43_015973 [Phytophthora oleae]|uniref:Uncharacterized protein n=1 Tax=Phytophthora oleae TaxID=2107226 RepID=A0ABD3F1T6_9STRA
MGDHHDPDSDEERPSGNSPPRTPPTPHTPLSEPSPRSMTSRVSRIPTPGLDRRTSALEAQLRYSQRVRMTLAQDRDHLDHTVHRLRADLADLQHF